MNEYLNIFLITHWNVLWLYWVPPIDRPKPETIQFNSIRFNWIYNDHGHAAYWLKILNELSIDFVYEYYKINWDSLF